MPDSKPYYTLYGFTMSPFSMKMRSYMRYRRIPFIWAPGKRASEVAQTKIPTYMVPVLETPDGVFSHDSTLMINALEEKYSDRSTTPDHEADAFLAALIEDLMDEWIMWAMYIHRWRTNEDRLHNSIWIIYEQFQGNTLHPAYDQMVQFWANRQVKGMELLAGNPDTIDESLDKFLSITEDVFSKGLFLFGSRPSRAEIAIYGILSQLIIDPTPAALLREKFNTTYRWVTLMEDISGIEGEWTALSPSPDKLKASRIPDILNLSGTYHLPMLAANDAALLKGEKFFTVELDGKPYKRKAHNRHDACLPALRQRYKNLSSVTKELLDGLLKDTGCYDYLAAADA
jgi:glutathione S-transferase